MERKLLAQLLLIFLLTQVFGLWAAHNFLEQDLRATIYSEDINDPMNSVFLIAYIIVFTVVLLVVLKLLKKKHSGIFLKLFEVLAVLVTSVLVFSIVVPEIAAFLLALAIIGLRFFLEKNIWIKNLASVVATVGAGAIIGISIGVLPVIIFVLALAVYDLIAVFKTRHMVVLAKAVTEKNLAFTFSLPTKKHVFQLGTGDLVVPLVFSAAALASASAIGLAKFVPSAAVLSGSVIGLVLTLDYGSKHVGKALPALPLQAALMVCFFVMAKTAGF